MILVTIHLVSAISSDRSRELGRMLITNDGKLSVTDPTKGDYLVRLIRKGTVDVVQKTTEVKGFPRKSTVIWALVARALKGLDIR